MSKFTGPAIAPTDNMTTEELKAYETALVYDIVDDAAQKERLEEFRQEILTSLETEAMADIRVALQKSAADDCELLQCLHTRRFNISSAKALLERKHRCIIWMDTLSTTKFAGIAVKGDPAQHAAISYYGISEEYALAARRAMGFEILQSRDSAGAALIHTSCKHFTAGLASHSLRGLIISAIKGMQEASLNVQTRVVGFTYVFDFGGIGMSDGMAAASSDVRKVFAPEFKKYAVGSMPWRICEVWIIEVPMLLMPFITLGKGIYADRSTMMKRVHVCGRGDKKAQALMAEWGVGSSAS